MQFAQQLNLPTFRGNGDERLTPRFDAELFPFSPDRLEAGVDDVGFAEVATLVDLVAADLSFISLRLVLPVVRGMVADGGFAIVLIKPQFEIGKGRVGKGGIVRDPKDHLEVLTDFVAWVLEQGWGIKGLQPSPIPGREGNREFLAQLVFDRTSGLREPELQGMIDACVYGVTDGAQNGRAG